jgi:hypothetical protein
MKISQIFSKIAKDDLGQETSKDPDQLGGTSTKIKDYINDFTNFSDCNCPSVITKNLTNEEKQLIQKDMPLETLSGRSKNYHKIIVNRLLGIMANKDTELLSKISGYDTAKGLFHHFLRHVEAAGINPNDFGISNDAYRKFKGAVGTIKTIEESRREQEQKSVQPVSKGFYPTKNCGVCNQYRKEFNDGIINFKNRASKEILKSNPSGEEQGPPVSEEFANESAAKMSKDITDSWRNGKLFKKRENPNAYKLQGILKNWNNHHEESHNISLNDLHGPDPRIPVTIDKEYKGRKPNVEQVYNNLLNQGSGWSKNLLEEPEDPFYKENPETGKQVPRFAPKEFGETEQEYEQRATQEAAIVLEENAYQPIKQPSSIKPKVVFTPGKRPGPWANESYEPLYPVEHFIRTDIGHENEAIPIPQGWKKRTINPPPLKTIHDFPWGTAYGYEQRNKNKSTDVMTEWTFNKNPLVYNPNEDVRPLKIRSLRDIPGTPEIEKAELLKGEESKIPRRDKFLFQQAGMMPDLTLIKLHNQKMREYNAQNPLERNTPKPEFDVDNARERYDKSRSEAIVKLFGSSDEEAEKKLEEAHTNAFKEKGQAIINSPMNKRFISKKENNMPEFIFNSNKKESHLDVSGIDFHSIGQAVWHGLKDVGHMLNTPVNQVREIAGNATPERATDAGLQLMAEGYGGARLMEKGIDKYDESFGLRPDVKEKVEKARRVLHPLKYDDEDSTRISNVIASLSDKINSNKKICTDCGKKCANKTECKSNQAEAKRDAAAQAAYND